MTRIVAGAVGGRRIVVPRSFRGRPTAERAREALFASLTTMFGSFDGLAVCDGYAGTGAVGLEALSRGASRVLFVESDRAAARGIADNLRTLGLTGGTVLPRRMEQVAAGAPPGREPFHVVFVDPPYPTPADEVAAVVDEIAEHGWLAADAVVVVERPTRDATFPWPERITAGQSRRYGEATLWYGHAQPG